MWVLSGIAVIALGFALRINPLLVVAAAAGVTGLAAGLDPRTVIAAFGKAFNEARFVSLAWIVLPVIGILERHGLQSRARDLVARLKGATPGRLLTGYLLLRQLTAALGLISIAGPAQTVRPLVVPMAEAAAGSDDPDQREQIRAMAAATDNVGLFFGEDMFIAIGSILLMVGVLQGYGIVLAPFELAVWTIPTAIIAFAVHAFRLWRLDRRLK